MIYHKSTKSKIKITGISLSSGVGNFFIITNGKRIIVAKIKRNADNDSALKSFNAIFIIGNADTQYDSK